MARGAGRQAPETPKPAIACQAGPIRCFAPTWLRTAFAAAGAAMASACAPGGTWPLPCNCGAQGGSDHEIKVH